MKEIVYATRDQRIMEELESVIPSNINMISLKDLPETAGLMGFKPGGKTFLENAITRAKYWEKILNKPVIATEEGLTIDALYGYPGIHSKRYMKEMEAQKEHSNSDYYNTLLKLMEQSDIKSTSAVWVCAMVFVQKRKTLYCVESLKGDMCNQAGEREFEFDQFFRPKISRTTLAEMSFEEKCNISPRNVALKKLFIKAFK